MFTKETSRFHRSWQPLQIDASPGIVLNKQVKGKVHAKEINMCVEHRKHSGSQYSFLKGIKENNQKKNIAEEKQTWVQMK